MKNLYPLYTFFALTGCGGGGGSTTNIDIHTLALPVVGSQVIYDRTITDNSNNNVTLGGSLRQVVTSVNTDGSFVHHDDDPTNQNLTMGGTNYSIIATSYTDNASRQTLSSVADTGSVSCNYAPHGGGPTYPVTVGSNWTSTWNSTCINQSPVTFTQTGTLAGVETITVPAGTFTVLKFNETTTWTISGTNWTQINTSYRSANSPNHIIKSLSAMTYTGTAPLHGYAVTTERQLKSYQ